MSEHDFMEQVDINEVTPFLDKENGIITFCEAYMQNFMPDGFRPFQKTVLRCRHKRVVLRIGRRSGKTHLLSTKAVYEAITNENYRILVVTPTQQQYEVIYDMIVNKILKSSPELNACMVRTTASPGRIFFTSGSQILFFSAGTKTGGGAMGVRGQGADFVIMDEADYLTAVDLESIMGLQYEHKNVIFWASSTPTGKRGYYYKWCTDKKLGWQEFHYPAPIANTEWDEVMEAQAKGDYINPDAYAREILAEFGTEETGVFNKDKLDICFNEGQNFFKWSQLHMPYYGYAMSPLRAGIRTIGVDWDKYGAPTNIIVLEILEDGRYMVINRTQIPQSEFTLTNAIKKLIELNKVWNPQFIYIDRGFGEVQAEILTLYGKEHKESGLHKIVKPVSFSSKINFINPATKQVEPKDAKHLMVNLLQRSIEDCRFIFNPNDDIMYTQLMDYHIQSIGISGRPIFTNKDDHTVDALMLAHLAIMQNFDTEFKTNNELYLKYQDHSKLRNRIQSNQKYLNLNDFLTDRINKSYKTNNISFKRFSEPKFISRSLGAKKVGGRLYRV